jgi:transcriptional regulator with XRE-family HTH domain
VTLKELLRQNKITQSQIAQKLGVSQKLVSCWCLNKSRPNYEHLAILSTMLQVTREELMQYFERKQKTAVNPTKDETAVLNATRIAPNNNTMREKVNTK